MYERKKDKLAPPHVFVLRLAFNIFIGFFLIGLCLLIRMKGYHYFEMMSRDDAYVNASMILSGMGPIESLKTESGKLFAGRYALFSGIIFLFFMAMIFDPVFHRFYHQFHHKDDK